MSSYAAGIFKAAKFFVWEVGIRDNTHVLHFLGCYCEPDDQNPEPDNKWLDTHPARARLECRDWWRRQLSRERRRRLEGLARRLGQVGTTGSPYVSDHMYTEYQEAQRRFLEYSENQKLEREDGHQITLADAVKSGPSNPEVRASEVYARVKGEERLARLDGMVGVFVTITLGADWHCRRAKDGSRVGSYNGTTPREAQSELTHKWALLRAAAGRREIAMRGLRVTEAHHDGTPHWHMLLWVPPDRVNSIESLFLHYFGQQTDIRLIDRQKGAAATYVWKYLQKHVSHDQDNSADTVSAPENGAERHRAWCWVWGFRQFQFFGLEESSITVWRQVRRLPDQVLDDDIEGLRQYARAGQWHMYVLLYRRLVAVGSFTRDRINRYYETVPEVVGVVIDQVVQITKLHTWRMVSA